MSTKEKAKELIGKYENIIFNGYRLTFEQAKICAMICANELLDNEPGMTFSICVDEDEMTMMEWKEYWQNVRNEIEIIAKT